MEILSGRGDSVLFARYTGGDSVLVNKKGGRDSVRGGFCPPAIAMQCYIDERMDKKKHKLSTKCIAMVANFEESCC